MIKKEQRQHKSEEAQKYPLIQLSSSFTKKPE
jgi:hypothetical protein